MSPAKKSPATKPAKAVPAPKTAGAQKTAAKTAKNSAPAKPAPAKAPAATAAQPVAGVQAPAEKLWEMHLATTATALAKRGFEASVVGSAKEAVDLVLQNLLPQSKAKTVAFGGSMTIVGSGLFEAMKKAGGVAVMDTYDTSKGPEAMIEMRRKAMACDFYLTSANALTRGGEILFVDGFGNRPASVQFGPLKVVLLIGRNKLVDDVETGIRRIKNFAAPANALRLNKKTPCTKTGFCMDCDSPDRICSTWTILSRSLPKGRIHVVLINEEIGF